MSLLSHIAQTRALWAKCARSSGLTWEEIATLLELEGLFASRPRDERRYSRRSVEAPAIVRSSRLEDEALITDVSLEGMRLSRMPYVEVGTVVEIIASDPDSRESYHFKAKVMWCAECDQDIYDAGVHLLGVPLHVRRRSSELTLTSSGATSHGAAA